MKQLLIFFVAVSFSSILISRSIYRESDPTIPYITVTTSHNYDEIFYDKEKTYKLQDKYLRLKTLKKSFERNFIWQKNFY